MDIFILRDGEQTGPFSETTVQTLLKQGGVRSQDMAWRKGLPAWLPVVEVLNPGSQKPTEPPPVQSSGIRSTPAAATPATGKQKALLKYLGVEFDKSLSKADAALLLSDAIENPKLQGRLARWGEEKFRLHPDAFQDESDFRKANRAARYLELCQTEAGEVVRDITKAHCQVLIESLDKRYPAWEANPRESLWNFLLPAVAEHFPTLVQGDWKTKLRFGSAPKTPPVGGRATAGEFSSTESGPAPLSAAIRGIVYGAVVLGLIVGGMKLLKKDDDAVGTDNAAAATAPSPAPTNVPEIGATKPAEAPAISPAPPLIVDAAPATPPPVEPVPAPQPEPPVPAANPPAEMRPEAPAVAAVPPASPVPPGPPSLPRATDTPAAPMPATVTPTLPPVVAATPATPGAPKAMLTLTKPVPAQLQFGRVTLNPGTKVRFIAAEGTNVRVNFNNSIIVVPAASTDYDGPPGPLPTAAIPTATAPTTPPAAPAPPKPVSSSDL